MPDYHVVLKVQYQFVQVMRRVGRSAAPDIKRKGTARGVASKFSLIPCLYSMVTDEMEEEDCNLPFDLLGVVMNQSVGEKPPCFLFPVEPALFRILKVAPDYRFTLQSLEFFNLTSHCPCQHEHAHPFA
ncbi:hypothetical protein QQP08_023616 [Theobroma cacao]|nr:hypothetical protein QQP08_023616 [Theobroma cacao]